MKTRLVDLLPTALAIVAVCTGASAAAKVKVGKPVQYAGAATVAQAVTLVQPSAKADFSTIKRVVIPYFQVEIQSKAGKNESSKAFMSKMEANASINYTITGVDAAALQALTDRLYADTIAAFRARGIEVLDRADARARSRSYAKLEAAFQTGPKPFSPAGGGKSIIYAPTGLGIYFAGVEGADPGGGLGMFGGIAGMAKSFSNMGSAMAEAQAPAELDAAIVGIRLKVSFVQTDSWKSNGFVQVSGKAAVSVSPIDTQLWIMAPKSQAKNNARVQFQLAAPIVPATNPIVSANETTSNGRKVDAAIGNLIGGLAGTSSYKVADYTVVIDPVIFNNAVGETLAGADTMLIDRLLAQP